MKAIDTGDIVTVDFPGATGIKRRPAVVVSTEIYHQYRPDVILGVITSQTQKSNTPSDYILIDWQTAGLNRQSAFRAFLMTMPASSVQIIGHCTPRDWEGIQLALSKAIALTRKAV
jgi:mRNA interferase MazF